MRSRLAIADVSVERQRRRLTRTIPPIREERCGDYYAKLYYVEDDDSFLLGWCLPHGAHGSDWTGLSKYVNPDECFHSYRYLVQELAKLKQAAENETSPALELL